MRMKFDDAFATCPLVAILRGITPEEAVAVADALYRAGIRIVEVPMNSPEPLDSISRIAKSFSGRLVCGAGTVLSPAVVDQVAAAGATVVIAPNTNPGVIRRARENNLVPMPGFATPSEAFSAYEAGARYLKLFPASSYGTGHLKALGAVLPADAKVLAVGGVGAADVAGWFAAGARGFGVGSELYRPGQPPDSVYMKAVAFMKALTGGRGGGPQ